FQRPSEFGADHDARRLGGTSPPQGLSPAGAARLREALPLSGRPLSCAETRTGKVGCPVAQSQPFDPEALGYEVVEREDDRMVLSVGPHHPSTHGVLRLVLELEGETVVKCKPEVGFLHTGIEKTAEALTWQQAITVIDRMDYLSPLSNNLAYVLAVEKLLGLEIPPRATHVRLLLTELQRIASHLAWLGTTGLDLGAQSIFFYS